MLCHATLVRHKKCPTCAYTCPEPLKEAVKVDLDVKIKQPSEATKKILGIKDE